MAAFPIPARFAFRSFLSHRYESPAVNLYFYRIFTRAAEVQFDVDVGKGDLSVTRIERMVRSADAFVGVYPYPGPELYPDRGQLMKVSPYFRFELDLAIRSGKPTVIFADARYGDIFPEHPSISLRTFDHQEVAGGGQSPQAEEYALMFLAFCERVRASMRLNPAASRARTKAGILLPDSYTGDEVREVRDFIRNHNL